MGKFTKWITGGLGWAFLGPIGGILGFALGSLFEDAEKATKQLGYSATTPGSFAVSLLVLAAAVMKADGKVMRSELDYVKKFLRQNFGEDSAAEALQMLRKLLNQPIPLQSVCAQIRQNLDYPARLELLHFLLNVAKADGQIHQAELNAVKHIAQLLGIQDKDLSAMDAMSEDTLEAAYKVLGISQQASDAEVKKAYRRMALKYHPDKVGHLGEDFKETAKEKFQKVSAAYEKISKHRNIK
ncbi:MAG: TerB family tellurite resistance protein [Bacteroidales bacterium]|jgi:DnaJ like chaperone protein